MADSSGEVVEVVNDAEEASGTLNTGAEEAYEGSSSGAQKSVEGISPFVASEQTTLKPSLSLTTNLKTWKEVLSVFKPAGSEAIFRPV
ncbi:MAG: hypothetical protein QXM16_05120 [Nitrososphaerota archaeon]